MPVTPKCGSLLKELCIAREKVKEWMEVRLELVSFNIQKQTHVLLKSLVDMSRCMFTISIDFSATAIEPNFPW
jgi:hypothetical protein